MINSCSLLTQIVLERHGRDRLLIPISILLSTEKRIYTAPPAEDSKKIKDSNESVEVPTDATQTASGETNWSYSIRNDHVHVTNLTGDVSLIFFNKMLLISATVLSIEIIPAVEIPQLSVKSNNENAPQHLRKMVNLYGIEKRNRTIKDRAWGFQGAINCWN